MSDKEHDLVSFFGRVTASYTHEMQNVLAIISESNGLMQDLLSMQEDQALAHREKFHKSQAVIEEQVQRGQKLTSRLNQLAHTPDHRMSSVDLADNIQMLLELSERIAKRKKVKLHCIAPEQKTHVHTLTVELATALFLALESCFQAASPEGEITVKPSISKEKAWVEFSCSPCSSQAFEESVSSQPSWSDLQELCSQLSGSIDIDASNCRLTLGLPLYLPGSQE